MPAVPASIISLPSKPRTRSIVRPPRYETKLNPARADKDFNTSDFTRVNINAENYVEYTLDPFHGVSASHDSYRIIGKQKDPASTYPESKLAAKSRRIFFHKDSTEPSPAALSNCGGVIELDVKLDKIPRYSGYDNTEMLVVRMLVAVDGNKLPAGRGLSGSDKDQEDLYMEISIVEKSSTSYAVRINDDAVDFPTGVDASNISLRINIPRAVDNAEDPLVVKAPITITSWDDGVLPHTVTGFIEKCFRKRSVLGVDDYRKPEHFYYGISVSFFTYTISGMYTQNIDDPHIRYTIKRFAMTVPEAPVAVGPRWQRSYVQVTQSASDFHNNCVFDLTGYSGEVLISLPTGIQLDGSSIKLYNIQASRLLIETDTTNVVEGMGVQVINNPPRVLEIIQSGADPYSNFQII